jgi:hypothetical protein
VLHQDVDELSGDPKAKVLPQVSVADAHREVSSGVRFSERVESAVQRDRVDRGVQVRLARRDAVTRARRRSRLREAGLTAPGVVVEIGEVRFRTSSDLWIAYTLSTLEELLCFDESLLVLRGAPERESQSRWQVVSRSQVGVIEHHQVRGTEAHGPLDRRSEASVQAGFSSFGHRETS